MRSSVTIKKLEDDFFKITVQGSEFDNIPMDELLDEEEKSLYSIWIKKNEYDIREKLSEKEIIVKLVR